MASYNEYQVETTTVLEAEYGAVQTNWKEQPITDTLLSRIIAALEARKMTVDFERYKHFTNEMGYDALHAINELPFPPSDKQLELIRKNCERLGEKMPPLESLSGGKNGTASKLISEQIERLKDMPRLATERMWSLVKRFRNCIDEDVDTKADELLTRKETGDEPDFDEVHHFIGWAAPIVAEWKKDKATREQVQEMVNIHRKMKTPYDYKMLVNIPADKVDECLRQWNREYRELLLGPSVVSEMEEDYFGRAKPNVKDHGDFVQSELRTAIWALASQIGERPEETEVDINMQMLKTWIDKTTELLISECTTPGQELSAYRTVERIIENCKCLTDEQRAELLYK